jgi:hypothetical protein
MKNKKFLLFLIFFVTLNILNALDLNWSQLRHTSSQTAFTFSNITATSSDENIKVGSIITFYVKVHKGDNSTQKGTFLIHTNNLSYNPSPHVYVGGNDKTYLQNLEGYTSTNANLSTFFRDRTFTVRTRVTNIIDDEVRMQFCIGDAAGFATANVIIKAKKPIVPLKIIKKEFSFKEGYTNEKPKYTVRIQFNRAIVSEDLNGKCCLNLDYKTIDATAVSKPDQNEAKFQRKEDYFSQNGTIALKRGMTYVDIPIQFSGDRFYENDEYFYIRLSSDMDSQDLNSDIKVTIENDDILYIGIEDGEAINEADAAQGKKVEFTIATDAVVPKGHGDVKVYFKTRDYTEGIPATANKDYQPKEGYVIIKEGDANTKTAITVYDDDIKEPNEQFAVDLTSAEGGTIFPTYSEGIGVILDNDNDKPENTDSTAIYKIYDPDSTDKSTIKTKVIGKTETIRISARLPRDSSGNPIKVIFIQQRRDCNTCGGCGSWYNYRYGDRYSHLVKRGQAKNDIKIDKTNYHLAKTSKKIEPTYIVTDSKLKTTLVSCGCGGGGGGGGGGCGGGCGSPCSSYSEYRNGDTSDNMTISQISLIGYDKSCSTQLWRQELLDKNEYLEIRDNQAKDFTFIPKHIAQCVKVYVKGKSDTDYTKTVQYTYEGISNDTFAIRPDRFEIKNFNFSNTNPNTSSKPIDFTLQAVDFNGIPTKLYDKKILTNEQLFYIYDNKYGTKDLKTYGFDINMNFKDGESNISTTYEEVGNLTFWLEEKKGKVTPYAQIDQKDKGETDKLLYIKPSNKLSFRIIPDHFDIDFTIKNQNDSGFLTFFANDIDNMSAYIPYTVFAKNANNKITKRYEKDGYSYDLNLDLTNHIVTQNNLLPKINFKNLETNNTKQNTINPTTKSVKTTSFKLKAKNFDKGILKDQIKVNFTREKNNPLEPIELFADKIDLIEINGIKNFLVTGTNTLSPSASVKFYYARVHAPSPQEVAGKELDAKIYYEIYCKGCNKNYFKLAKNRASIDDVYWYILPRTYYCTLLTNPLNNYQFIGFARNENIDKYSYKNDGKSNFEIFYIKIKKAPDLNKVYYKSYDYLLFDRYNKNVNEHNFNIRFSSSSSQWAGEGELGQTIDMNISTIPNQSIDW